MSLSLPIILKTACLWIWASTLVMAAETAASALPQEPNGESVVIFVGVVGAALLILPRLRRR
jgi:hypothetical protein